MYVCVCVDMNRTLNSRASSCAIHEFIHFLNTTNIREQGWSFNRFWRPIQAYLCLSDETKRRSFNIDRRNNICLKCSRVSHKSKENRNDSKPNRFCQTLKDIRDKFREENMVIERCLKTNSAFFMGNRTNETPPVYGIPKQNRINKESPVFNPSDYRLWGYPHVRNRVFDYNLSSDWNMFTRSRSTCVHSS